MRRISSFTKFSIENTARVPVGKSSEIVAVFGANGFLGRYVIQHLVRTGRIVVAAHRCDPYDMRHLHVLGDLGQLHCVPFQARDDSSLERIVNNADHVINLVGLHYDTKHFSFENVHIDFPEALARVIKEHGDQVKTFVHLSALGADFASPSRFMRSKAWGEHVVRENVPEAVIVRPGPMFGSEDRFLLRYGRMIKALGTRLPLMRPERLIQPVSVSDVARVIMQAIQPGDQASLLGKTVYAGFPQRYTERDLVEYIQELLMKPIGIKPLPKAAVKLGARVLDAFAPNPFLVPDELIVKSLDLVVPRDLPRDGLSLTSVVDEPLPIESVALNIVRQYREGKNEAKPVPKGVRLRPATQVGTTDPSSLLV